MRVSHTMLLATCLVVGNTPMQPQAPATPGASRAPETQAYTLTVPTAELLALLKTQLFTDSGRFYPCRNNPSCASWGEDLALSSPSVRIDGPRLMFAVHVTGTYAFNQMLAPSVSGDLIVSAIPFVRSGLVHLMQSSVRAGEGDLTFQAFVQGAHSQIESLLNEKSSLDLTQYLAMTSRDPRLPPPRIPGQTCLDPAQIHVISVTTDPPTSAMSAMVTVASAPRGPRSC